MVDLRKEAVNCGYCEQSSHVIDDPRVLPCEHVHCMACLTANYNIRKAIQCSLPYCRKVFDVDLQGLPLHTRRRLHFKCDICIKKDKERSAVVYCITCSKKYCIRHRQSHDDIMEQHPIMLIEQYGTEAVKLDIRLCTTHTSLPYLRACKTCLVLMCVECLCRPGECSADSGHEIVQIDELILHLKKETDQMIEKLVEREKEQEKLIAYTTQALTDHETLTQQFLTTPKLKSRSTRHLSELRDKSKCDIRNFAADIVEMWSEGSSCRLKAAARFTHSHQVDVINTHKDTITRLEGLVYEKIPSLRFEDVQLINEDGKMLLTSFDSRIDHARGLTTTLQSPKSTTLLKSVKLPSCPLSLCHFEGNTYIGLQDGTVCKIDSNYEIQEQFLTYKNPVAGITVHKRRVYALVYGSPMQIIVSDLSGNLIATWKHPDKLEWCNKLTIVRDQLIIPDRTNRQLVVYSLTGERLSKFACHNLSESWVGACALKGSNSMFISNYKTSQVFALDIQTGRETWKNHYTIDPLGITSYGQNNLLVFNSCSGVFEVLNINTGEVLWSFEDSESRKYDVLDLAITGNTMIVPVYQTMSVHFHQLNNH